MVICDLNTARYNQKRLKKYIIIITNGTLTMKNDYDFFFFLNLVGIIYYGMGNTILLKLKIVKNAFMCDIGIYT